MPRRQLIAQQKAFHRQAWSMLRRKAAATGLQQPVWQLPEPAPGASQLEPARQWPERSYPAAQPDALRDASAAQPISLLSDDDDEDEQPGPQPWSTAMPGDCLQRLAALCRPVGMLQHRSHQLSSCPAAQQQHLYK